MKSAVTLITEIAYLIFLKLQNINNKERASIIQIVIATPSNPSFLLSKLYPPTDIDSPSLESLDY